MLEQSAGWEDRISALERDNHELNKAVADLHKQVRQRELDAAYMYIHSNWQWIAGPWGGTRTGLRKTRNCTAGPVQPS